jgi:hypothetical protein
MERKQTWTLALLAVAGVLLAACGGGGGGGGGLGGITAPPATVGGSDVPVSATTSADGAFSFVADVAAQQDDAAEPLVLGDAVLATSETDEPKALR